MENVEIKQSKKGNPKYCLLDIPMAIRVSIDTENSCRVFIQSREVDYQKITGRETDHELYITSVKKEEYPIFCKSLINHVRSLIKRKTSLQSVFNELFNQYRTETETKKEVFNLQNEFKELSKLKKEFDKKYEEICGKMEML